MDDKTEELRDLFLEVADEETVTESQEATRGSLAADGDSVDERLCSVIEQMREKFAFASSLSEEELCRVVRSFYDGSDDDDIADALDVSSEAVFRARMDLHLVRDDDPPLRDGAVDADEETVRAARERLEIGEEPSDIADELSLDERTAEQIDAVVTTRDRSRRVSHRFRTAFEEILTDADLTVQFAADAHEDGLEEATEDAEVDVDF